MIKYNNAMVVDEDKAYVTSFYGKSYFHLRNQVEQKGWTIIAVKRYPELILFIVKNL